MGEQGQQEWMRRVSAGVGEKGQQEWWMEKIVQKVDIVSILSAHT